MFHKTAGALLLLSFELSAAQGVTSESFLFPENGVFYVGIEEGGILFRQCSRSAPQLAEDFWRPEPFQIQELESRLPGYLEQLSSIGMAHPPKGAAYFRQYIGFVQNGKRLIYGNYYPDYAAPGNRSMSPLVVCDGGSVFWGIVYEPNAKQFSQLEMNHSI